MTVELDRRGLLRTVTGAAGLLAAGSASTTTVAASSAPSPDEYDDVLSSMEGSGTAEEPYLVTDAHELQSIAGDLGAHYALADDVDASETSEWNDGAGFVPIGSFQDPGPFEGRLDGRGHRIRGLSIDRPAEEYVGLFGFVEGPGTGVDPTVRDVSLEAIDVVGGRLVGGIAGAAHLESSGRIEGVAVSGNVGGPEEVGGAVGLNFGTVEAVEGNVVITGGDDIGGLVGINRGTVRRARMAVSLQADSDGGGIIGMNHGTLERVHVTGSLLGGHRLGGAAGWNGGTVETVEALVDVAGDALTGGLVGRSTGEVTKSFAAGDVVGTGSVGGLVGESQGGSIGSSGSVGDVEATAEGPVGGAVGQVHQGGVRLLEVSTETATVSDVFATGSVAGSGGPAGGLVGELVAIEGDVDVSVRSAYATGAVTGGRPMGGLVGRYTLDDSFRTPLRGLVTATSSGEVPLFDSYWDRSTTGVDVPVGSHAEAAGATGLDTVEMTGESARTAMVGFDFGTAWLATEGYPQLSTTLAPALTFGANPLGTGARTEAIMTLDRPDGATFRPVATPTFESRDESIATVDPTGTVTGRSVGAVTLVAELPPVGVASEVLEVALLRRRERGRGDGPVGRRRRDRGRGDGGGRGDGRSR